MTESRFQVIVIGSGPAGATAAYRLARDGFKTLLLEKEKLPRYKVCGGALTRKVFQKIDFDITPLVEETITQIELAHHHRTLVQLDFAQQPISLVMRDKFDHYLTERAAQAGARVHDAEPVKQISFPVSESGTSQMAVPSRDRHGISDNSDGVRVKTNAGEYTAEIVVGADGANGITARAANLHQPRSIAAGLELEIAVGGAQLDAWRNKICLDFGAIPYGYAWIFPKANLLSVGVATYVRGPLYRHFALRRGEPRADLRARLNEWVQREPTLRDPRALVARGHLMPLGGRAIPLHGARVVLAGDAGGLIEPLFAEGIYYALRSGQIAAEVIADAFRRQDLDLSPYTRRIESEFLPEFQKAAGMARFTYRFPYFGLAALAFAPPLRTSLTQIMDGHAHVSPVWSLVRTTGNWLDAL